LPDFQAQKMFLLWLFFISHNFYFSFVSTSLAYFTTLKIKGKTKLPERKIDKN